MADKQQTDAALSQESVRTEPVRTELQVDAKAALQARREEWWLRIKELARAHNRANWELGDALNDGEGLFGDDEHNDHYQQAERITRFTRAHLVDIASTAKRFPKGLRNEALSWSHHRVLINTLPDASDDELKKWLQQAVEHGSSVKSFTEEVKESALDLAFTKREIKVQINKGVYAILEEHFYATRRLTVEEVILQGLHRQYEKVVEEHQAAMRAAARKTMTPYELAYEEKEKKRKDEEEQKARLAKLAQEDTMAENPDEFMAAKEKDQAG